MSIRQRSNQLFQISGPPEAPRGLDHGPVRPALPAAAPAVLPPGGERGVAAPAGPVRQRGEPGAHAGGPPGEDGLAQGEEPRQAQRTGEHQGSLTNRSHLL